MGSEFTETEQIEKLNFPIMRAFEKKFLFSDCDVDFVLDLLQHTCLPDRRYPGNYIYTIYCDTEDLDAYYEKLNGDTVKEKLRIRWYDDSYDLKKEYLKAFVEIKSKDGVMIKKVRKYINLPNISFKNLTLVDSLWREQLRQVSIELGWRNSGKLYPIILIEYKRFRFLDVISGARISVDTKISGKSINAQLLPTSQPASLNVAVLEVKGGNRLPIVLDILRGLSFRWESFSKYFICLEACIKEGDRFNSE